MDNSDPAETLAATVKALRWAGFMLAAMLLVLVIDLQLKRSVAKQAVTASELYARTVATLARDMRLGANGGPGASDSHAGHPGGPGRDGMAGDAPLAAGTGQADPAAAGVQDPAPAGPGKRPAGNGRRTVRPDQGS